MTAAIAWTGAPLSMSNSEIQTFKDCHRKWYLTHYLQWGVPDDHAEAGARNLGVQVALTMDAWYSGRTDNPVDYITALYDEDIAKWPNAVTELEKEKDLARAMLQGYVEWLEETGADEFLRTVATEATIEVDSPVPGVKMKGRLDRRIVRTTDGARLFLDDKTRGSIDGEATLLPLDEQMKFYCLLEYLDAVQKTGDGPPERTDGGLYNILRRVKRTASAKPPFYGRIEVRHNMDTLRSMYKRVQRVIEEIVVMRQSLDAGGDHQYLAYPRPSKDCKWKCPFVRVCPMMDDGSNWEGLLEEHYTHVDPYARYGDGRLERSSNE